MKRSLSFILFTVAIFLGGTFSASAVREFSGDGLSFSVPDVMQNDSDWAQQQGYAYAFCDDDSKIEFNVNIFANEGYISSGLDDESLKAYASDFEDSLTMSGEIVDSISIEPYKLSDGAEGMFFKILLASGEKNYFYWLATKETCYQFDFYFDDADCEKYVEQIMSTVVIESSESYGKTDEAITDDEIILDEDFDADDIYIDEATDVEGVNSSAESEKVTNKTENKDGEPTKDDKNILKFVIVIIGLAAISGVIMFFKKKKEKKDLAEFLNSGANYGVPYTPRPADNQQTQPAENFYQGGGYVENTGYAPDYDYSNKLDMTFDGTDDFSKTEYKIATQNMEKKFSDYEED